METNSNPAPAQSKFAMVPADILAQVEAMPPFMVTVTDGGNRASASFDLRPYLYGMTEDRFLKFTEAFSSGGIGDVLEDIMNDIKGNQEIDEICALQAQLSNVELPFLWEFDKDSLPLEVAFANPELVLKYRGHGGLSEEACRNAFGNNTTECVGIRAMAIMLQFGWDHDLMDELFGCGVWEQNEHLSDEDLAKKILKDANDAQFLMDEKARNKVKKTNAEKLKKLIGQGLTFSDCIAAFAANSDSPFVTAAKNLIQGGNDIEMDEKTVLSEGKDGAWVLTWLWVSNAEAGVLGNADLLENVLDAARAGIQKSFADRSPEANKELQVYADWLEDLITNYADELDGIEEEKVTQAPGSINWEDNEVGMVTFMPSTAINQLRLMARLGGLPDNLADQAEKFSLNFGNKLDAVLKVIQT